MSPALIWFLIGIGFLIAELALPGFIIIFFCLGSWAAALAAVLVQGLSWTWLIAIFLVFSLASLLGLRKAAMRTFRGKDEDVSLDGLDAQDKGKPALVTRSIVPPAAGEIKFKGSFWRAVADGPIDEGRTVTICGRASQDRLIYRVAPVDPPEQPSGGDHE
jgi:membrane protein implicated in regulation of membrane protease activity